MTGKPEHSTDTTNRRTKEPFLLVHLEFILRPAGNHLGRHLLRRSQLLPSAEANFPRISGIAQRERRIKFPIVSRITEDDKGNLWIGTEGGGVNRYNAETQTYKRYTLDNIPGGTAQNNIKAIYYDAQRETLWLGVHMAGLYKLNTQTGNITPYKRRQGDKHSILSNSIESILPIRANCYWLPTTGFAYLTPKPVKANRSLKTPIYTAELCTPRAWYGTIKAFCG